MQHVVYYEPSYDDQHPNLWQLRGHYKYPSILGNLKEQARITILMHETPPQRDKHRKRLETEFGVSFERISTANHSGPGRGDRLTKALMPELERIGADIVSNLNGRTISYCYSAARAAKALGLRSVMRVGGDDLTTKAHVFEKWGRPFTGTSQYLQLIIEERLATELADAIIVMTRREQARLQQIAREPNKVEVCYRGVDQSKFRVNAPRNGPCRRFLFVGRKSPEKGYDILEAAAKKLWQSHPDVTFTFAGTFEKGQEDNRHYIGYIDFNDLPQLYSDHDAVIVCSRTEGFPQVVMEAMSMGLPCIMSRHLFEKEFIEGENALFTSNDPIDLAEKIGQISDAESELYALLSEQSLIYARDNFDDQKLARHYQSTLLQG